MQVYRSRTGRAVTPGLPVGARLSAVVWTGRGRAAGVARLVGERELMRELKARIARAAVSPFPLVIEGESRARKELIA